MTIDANLIMGLKIGFSIGFIVSSVVVYLIYKLFGGGDNVE